METFINYLQSFPIPIKINTTYLQNTSFNDNGTTIISLINDTKLQYTEMVNLCYFLYLYYYQNINIQQLNLKIFIKNFIEDSIIQINEINPNKLLRFQSNNFSEEEILQIYSDYKAEGFFNTSVIGAFYAFETSTYFQGTCHRCKLFKQYVKNKKVPIQWLGTLTKYHNNGYCLPCLKFEYKIWTHKIKLWQEEVNKWLL